MIPRPEYPRPDFVRENWINLNGEWEFCIDRGSSGTDRKFYEKPSFDEKILVPFCPESKLSGVEYTDFMNSVWYAKNVVLNAELLQGGVILHVGACDYHTAVYVNGKKVGTHTGGYTSFSFPIAAFLHEGENRIVIHAADDVRSKKQPRGKQCDFYYSRNCDYTRTTGIWQTVWLEFVPATYLKKVNVDATDLGGTIIFETILNDYCENAKLRVNVSLNGTAAGETTFSLCGTVTQHALQVSPVALWQPSEPNLYDVTYTLYVDGIETDCVKSYFGIRRVDIQNNKVLINGKPIFQRLILDQGFYPDGVYTAPSDADLERDIKLSMQVGFNGARLHQKVFEERFLYHADRLGYIVWGEYASWGIDQQDAKTLHTFLPQWTESVERDRNHPCIVAWCPFNETWDTAQNKDTVYNVYLATKALDKTRPVIDTSGGFHVATDIYDVHDYEQDPKILETRYKNHANGEYFIPFSEYSAPYDGKRPYMVSEYGGIRWSIDNDSNAAWGYGNTPSSTDELCRRFCALTETMLDNESICGFCYTQLTDVEQEQNGLYYYDRSKKFTEKQYESMRKSVQKKAAIER